MFDVTVRGRVNAVVFAGASLGPMLGVPAGTWIAQQHGWRSAFLALSALALAAFAALAARLPPVEVASSHAATGTNPDRRRYTILVTVTSLSVAGLYASFTYTEIFLTQVTGFAAAALAALLLARGIADSGGIAAGSLLGAAVLDGHGPRATPLAGGLLALAALALFLAEPLLTRRTPEVIRR